MGRAEEGIELTVTDDAGITAKDRMVIYNKRVNTNAIAPTINPIPDKVILVESTLSFQVVFNDPDPFDMVTLIAYNLPDGASFDPNTGQFSWVPTWQQLGNHTVEFEASDGYFSDREEVNIFVRRPMKDPLNFKRE